MADIRIKDLTTTASSTASDDFIAVDGTTNGTRKLNAFSPTFGGNATVTGTLTANSAITGPTLIPGLNTAAHYFTAYGASASWPFRISTIYDADYVDHYLTLNGTLTGSRATPTFTGAAAGGAFLRANGFTSTLSVGTFGAGAGAAINTVANFNPTNVTIPQTTASTTTSTGALVVGNGTSGGLGVGGNITLGGGVNIAGAASDPLPAGTSGLWTLSGSGLRINSAGYTFASLVGNSASTATFTLNGTTAPTSPSSGALVVTGGVGVGGNLYVGGSTGVVVTTAAYARLTNITSDAGSAADIRLQNTGASGRDIFLGSQGSTSSIVDARSRFMLYDNTGGGLVLSASGADNVKIHLTTASTTTSSGALVVSGGVGVAKTIRVGEEVIIDQPTSNPTLLRLYSNGGNGTYTNFAESSMGGQSTNVAFLRWTRGGNEDRELSVHVSNYAGTSIKATTIDPNGNLIQKLNGTAASLATNSTMTFELTSNTSLKIFVRGSDGTTRSTTLTLA